MKQRMPQCLPAPCMRSIKYRQQWYNIHSFHWMQDTAALLSKICRFFFYTTAVVGPVCGLKMFKSVIGSSKKKKTDVR